MKGFTALFAHKKHSMTIVGLLLLVVVQAVAEHGLSWLPSLSDHMIDCITILVITAVICQTLHDITELVVGIWKPDVSELVQGLTTKSKGQQQ